MIRHLCKLLWNRKKNNLWIALEILLSFLTVFFVAVTGFYFLDNFRKPLGFQYKDIWDIQVGIPESLRRLWIEASTEEIRQRLWQLVQTVDAFPEVDEIAYANMTPYDGSRWTRGYESAHTSFSYDFDEVSDRFPRVLNLQLIQGRWFDKSDDGANYWPVVINRQFAEQAFGAENPIGKSLDQKTDTPKRPTRILGVFSDYRKTGELSPSVPFALYRSRLDDRQQSSIHEHILIRVRPGTSLDFEEKLVTRLNSMEREWSFQVRTVESLRRDSILFGLLPLAILGIVALSLLAMVGSGLMGVLWQNIAQRTREIGLRRAQGASAQDIRRQILLEVGLITFTGVGIGFFLLLQLPLLQLIPFLGTDVFLYGLVFSCLLIYGIVFLCALYPAYLATRVQPAEALRYE